MAEVIEFSHGAGKPVEARHAADTLALLRTAVPGERLPHETMMATIRAIMAFSREEQDHDGMREIEQMLHLLHDSGTLGADVALDALAQAYGHRGDPERGLAILEWIGEPQPIADPSTEALIRSDYHSNRARLLASHGDHQRAAEAYDAAIALVPVVPDHRPGSIRTVEVEYLHALERAGRYEDAVAYAALRASEFRRAGVPGWNEQMALQLLRQAAERAGDADTWRAAMDREIELLDRDGGDASRLVLELLARDQGVEVDAMRRPIPRDDPDRFLLDAAARLLPYASQGHAEAFERLDRVLQGYALVTAGTAFGGRLSENSEQIHQEIALAAQHVLGDPDLVQRFEILREHHAATMGGERIGGLSARLGTEGRASAGIDLTAEPRIRRIGAASAATVARDAEYRGERDLARWYHQIVLEIVGDSAELAGFRRTATEALLRLSETPPN